MKVGISDAIVLALLICLTSLMLSCRQTQKETDVPIDSLFENRLESLLKDREFFQLRLLLDKNADRISAPKKQLFTAYAENAFNQNSRSAAIIQQLLKDENLLDDSIKADLLLVQRDNYIKMFEYAKAAETGKLVIGSYGHLLKEKKLHDIKNLNKIYEGLAQTPAQGVVLSSATTINGKKDKLGLVNIPVRTGSKTYEFVFDTRASISTIMKSYAEKLELTILDVKYQESSGITGNSFEARLGVADSLYIGTLLVTNVVFQIVPDEILSFPFMDYAIHGIIGFPVITQWKEVHINRDGKIVIPAEQTKTGLKNLAFDEATTVVSLRTEDDTLSFHFDSGATTSALYYNYFNKYNSKVTSTAKTDTIQLGGAGGVKQTPVYILPSYVFYINNREVTLKNIHVLTSAPYAGQKYNGNLGQDLFGQFNELIFNFEDMYIDFK